MKNNYRTEYSVINHNLTKKMTFEYDNYHTIIILHIEYRIINCKGKRHESKYIEFMNADFQLLERLYNKNYIHSLNII